MRLKFDYTVKTNSLQPMQSANISVFYFKRKEKQQKVCSRTLKRVFEHNLSLHIVLVFLAFHEIKIVSLPHHMLNKLRLTNGLAYLHQQVLLEF